MKCASWKLLYFHSNCNENVIDIPACVFMIVSSWSLLCLLLEISCAFELLYDFFFASILPLNSCGTWSPPFYFFFAVWFNILGNNFSVMSAPFPGYKPLLLGVVSK